MKAPDQSRPTQKRSMLPAGDGEAGTTSLLRFLQPCRFPAEPAQEVELGAADLGRAQDLNLVDHLRIDGKDALHALAEADLAHGEAGVRAARARNHGAFEGL